MNLLVAEDISKSYTERMLFNQVSFGISEGERIGLIGINGTGKSTLLRIVAGLEETDSGTITRNSKLSMAFLPQKPEFDDNKSILQNVISGKKAEQDYRNLEGEAAAMLLKLDITDPSISPRFLSGGQKKRVALVKTLLTPTNLLILDEPTNHLDSTMTEWLSEQLNRYKGAILMVTHDRYFLDEVTNRILELDKGALYSYMANYSQFIALKAEREEMTDATERKAKSLYKTELAWMLRGARARSTKQKAHIQRFEALRDRGKIEIDDNIEINAAFTRLGKKTAELNNVSKSYDGVCYIKDFSYIFLQGDRIGIIGKNGCGKSTLVRMITGEETADSGTIDIGTTVKLGYFSQENEHLDENKRVIDYIRDTAEYIKTKDGVLTASQMAENFLFTGAMQYNVIGKLSGGEKRRLYLLKVLMEAPNILILDEPTNDLDIKTLTILEDYLQCFEGIVIAVSHDRYFLDKLARRIFAFEGEGRIKQYEGNYTDYKNAVDATLELDTKDVSKTVKPANTTDSTQPYRPKKLKFTYAEQREFETIDEVIASLEDAIKTKENEISEASTQYSLLEQLLKEKEELETELEAKTERWLYLNELADKIQNQ